MAFEGRTIQLVSDIREEEQLYLYERTRLLRARQEGTSVAAELKNAPPLAAVDDADVSETVNSLDSTVYLLFMEESTRTKESFRNAARHLNVKVNEFSASNSSFTKGETITDTMKMLSVYSTQRTIFIMRTPHEGVCSWLKNVMHMHAKKYGIPSPAFINAGDGRYTHPIAEMVDIFSLLEVMAWSRESVHVALVGDLAHGRTAHSKVDGLKIFNKVRVDLIAPDVFEYPVEYRNRMKSNGFQLREFDSVERYMKESADDLAQVWYFFQPQIKRHGDVSAQTMASWRSKVSFVDCDEWKQKLRQETVFFQTLPRSKANPLVPLAFDSTPLNGWDRVANNAYFLHVVLLSMVFGKVGRSLPAIDDAEVDPTRGVADRSKECLDRLTVVPDFLEDVDLSAHGHRRNPDRAASGSTVPLEDGLVVDHVCLDDDPSKTWRRLRMVRTVMGWSKSLGSEGVYRSKRNDGVMKGILSFPNFDFESLSVPQLKVLASVAPGCTVNVVKGSQVVKKFRLKVPLRIYNLPNIRCINQLCVSNPLNKQRDIPASFERTTFYETSAIPGCKAAEYLYICKYCKWPHQYKDIWSDDTVRYYSALKED